MADTACRSCGTTVQSGIAECPECGTVDPVIRQAAADTVPVNDPSAADPVAAETTPHTEPAQESPDAGTRVKNAGKAVGCFVIALLVLGIAVAVGLLDFLF